MALYSVWDWDRNVYRVYKTNSPVSVGDDPIAPKPTGLSAIGADPDTHIKALPSGAKFMGYSHLARGELRRMSHGLGDRGDDAGSSSAPGGGGWKTLALGVVVGAGVVWFTKVRR